MSKLLKPATSSSSVSIRVPTDLAGRLAAVQAAAKACGLLVDVDAPLNKALARLVRQAERELADVAPAGSGAGTAPSEPTASAAALGSTSHG